MEGRSNHQLGWIIQGMEMAFQKGEGLAANSLLDALEGLTAEQAAWKHPEADLHSIWEIVNHIASWNDYAVRLLNGVSTEPIENWPKVEETNEKSWIGTIEDLKDTHSALIKRLHKTELDLDEDFPNSEMPTGKMLFGQLAHYCYHTGQILTHRRLQGIGL